MNEADFLHRIRDRQSSIINHQLPHPGKFLYPVRTLPADLVEEFSQRLTAVGGHVYPVSDAATARLRLRDIIKTLRQNGQAINQAVVTGHAILREWELDSLLARLGLATFDSQQARIRIRDADLGLTGIEYAVAASGTIVVAASPRHPRSASLLPPVHIAVMRQAQLLPDLSALADRLHQDYPERPPSGLALITGPSRTADIEQTLSIGVHGPGELHALLIQ